MRRTIFTYLLAAIYYLGANVSVAEDQPAKAEPTCKQLADTLIPQLSILPYEEFSESGWRKLASRNCFFEAGSSIVGWLNANHLSVDAGQMMSLRYQAARVFAMTGRSDIALIHIRNARNADQLPAPLQNWNAYVGSFEAWLDRDIAELKNQIALLELQPVAKDGFKPNLIAAKRFLVCFNKSYSEIETGDVCLQAARASDAPAASLPPLPASQ